MRWFEGNVQNEETILTSNPIVGEILSRNYTIEIQILEQQLDSISAKLKMQ